MYVRAFPFAFFGLLTAYILFSLLLAASYVHDGPNATLFCASMPELGQNHVAPPQPEPII